MLKVAVDQYTGGKVAVTQKIGEPAHRHQREADARLAKVAGTNRQYIAEARKPKEKIARNNTP